MMSNETRIHPETGRKLRRGIRPATVEYRGRKKVVDLPGWYPDGKGDGIVSASDMRTLDQAFDDLKVESTQPEPQSQPVGNTENRSPRRRSAKSSGPPPR